MSRSKARRAKSISRLRVLFVLMFLASAAFLAYDVLVYGPAVAMNPYNPRLEALEERTLRGPLLDRNGLVLAETVPAGESGAMMRQYPYGEAFAHVLGFTGHGKTGIEAAWNQALLTSGDSLWHRLQADFTKGTLNGRGLKLTLDSSLQLAAYNLLEGKSGAVAAIEPSTGRVLALVSTPAFDPNAIAEMYSLLSAKEEDAPLLNRASQGLYAPGSTFKLLTALAYIRHTGSEAFSHECTGSIVIDGRKIQCYNQTAHGLVDLETAIAYSCNTAFAAMSRELPVSALAPLAEAFGFNQPLPWELPSSVSSFGSVGGPGTTEWAETLIGQGRTLVSPLHGAMLAAALANGGRMMAPYVVDAVLDAQGRVVEDFYPSTAASPISSSEAFLLGTMMEKTVSEGTASSMGQAGFAIAGKTGSAENPSGPAHGWFIGYAPADRPAIALAVLVEHGGSGATSAVPIAEALFETFMEGGVQAGQ